GSWVNIPFTEASSSTTFSSVRATKCTMAADSSEVVSTGAGSSAGAAGSTLCSASTISCPSRTRTRSPRCAPAFSIAIRINRSNNRPSTISPEMA
ncbi:hypothetical protein STIAU_6691, partial [Stigmatella aurantiaca DW4/3-1]